MEPFYKTKTVIRYKYLYKIIRYVTYELTNEMTSRLYVCTHKKVERCLKTTKL